ncbi:MAG: hypothetical protein GX605_12785 [Chloroflexi bacterium]|nr:hypothetical protein [Chloroflexota bacterium]
MGEPGFWLGFFVGVLVSGVLGFLLARLRLLQKRLKAPGEPQRVMQKTDKAPLAVVSDAIQAVFDLVFWLAVAGLLLYLVWRFTS